VFRPIERHLWIRRSAPYILLAGRQVSGKTEEEDEHGVITVREKESFSNELTVVFSTGQVAILK
jgi:hypothetical protein